MYTNPKWVFEWLYEFGWVLSLSWGLVRLMTELHTCLPLLKFIQDEKKRAKYNILLCWILSISYIFSSANTICSFALFRSQSFCEPTVCWDGNRQRWGGKGLTWHRTGQADEVRHFIPLGRDHSFACIVFCFLLFLKLVPPVALGGCALNICRTICEKAVQSIFEISILKWFLHLVNVIVMIAIKGLISIVHVCFWLQKELSDKTFTELLNFTDGLSSIFSWFVAVRLSTTCPNACLSQSHVMITAFCVFTFHLCSFPTLVILLINLCPIIHPYMKSACPPRLLS